MPAVSLSGLLGLNLRNMETAKSFKTFIYQGKAYNSRKELKQLAKLSTTKVDAKIKGGEIIVIINNTMEGNSYEQKNP